MLREEVAGGGIYRVAASGSGGPIAKLTPFGAHGTQPSHDIACGDPRIIDLTGDPKLILADPACTVTGGIRHHLAAGIPPQHPANRVGAIVVGVNQHDRVVVFGHHKGRDGIVPNVAGAGPKLGASAERNGLASSNGHLIWHQQRKRRHGITRCGDDACRTVHLNHSTVEHCRSQGCGDLVDLWVNLGCNGLPRASSAGSVQLKSSLDQAQRVGILRDDERPLGERRHGLTLGIAGVQRKEEARRLIARSRLGREDLEGNGRRCSDRPGGEDHLNAPIGGAERPALVRGNE